MDSDKDILYKMAVSMTPGVSSPMVVRAEECGLSPEDFIRKDLSDIIRILGLSNPRQFDGFIREEALDRARQELKFVRQHNIHTIFLTDDEYPWLLRETPDAPVLIYKLGDADLNAGHSANVVGTRRSTQYGISACRNLVTELVSYFPDMLVYSGLAFGIDSAAHNACLDHGATTVAVMAHGLDMIYPAANRDLARDIIRKGGALISEYPSGSKPYRNCFLERNRIVAGASEITIVVESPIKGGAMSTANLAFSYDREVVAVPGRIGDESSAGCNLLIRKHKANIVTSAADIIELMGWAPADVQVKPRQRNLFPELEGNSAVIYEAMKFNGDNPSIDTLHQWTRLPVSELMAALAELEFDGIVMRLPGNRYSLSV